MGEFCLKNILSALIVTFAVIDITNPYHHRFKKDFRDYSFVHYHPIICV